MTKLLFIDVIKVYIYEFMWLGNLLQTITYKFLIYSWVEVICNSFTMTNEVL